MDLKTSIIDLDSIEINTEFPQIEEKSFLYLANSIAKLKGLLQIPIVKQLGIDSYELISGFLEYQAYLKALEINSELPDRIRVFIIDGSNETLIREQMKVIEDLKFFNLREDNQENSHLSISIKNLYSAIEELKKDIRNTSAETKGELLQAIDSKLPTPLPPLEAFNQIDNPKIATMVTQKMAFVQKHKSIIKRLKEIKEQDPNKKYHSFGEIIKALGKGYISKEKMLDVIDNWE